MKPAIIVPARYASQRYPGKPLALLTGANGTKKPLIQRSWEAAKAVPGDIPVYVATDDMRISDAAQAFGADVLITDPACRNGTERCAEAASQIEADLIINLQGDAPLTPDWFVTDLIAAMSESNAGVATPVFTCTGAHLAALLTDRKAGRVGGTTAVCNQDGNALYFSKEVLPFIPDTYNAESPTPVKHHVGCYAYTRDALQAYMNAPECALEKLEGLEQLRFLYMGMNIKCVEVDTKGQPFWELNNPEDIYSIEEALQQLGII